MRKRIRITGFMILLVLGAGLFPGGYGAAANPALEQMEDVKPDVWYCRFVDNVLDKGFMQGTSGITFQPEGDITRRDFVTLLGRAAGIGDSSAATPVSSPFTDVETGKYYSSHVAWAAREEIIPGIDEHTYAPEQTITRQDMAVWVYLFAKNQGIALADGKGEAPFNDDQAISDYAKGAVYALKAAGVLHGVGQNVFDPQSNATRAEAAKLLSALTNTEYLSITYTSYDNQENAEGGMTTGVYVYDFKTKSLDRVAGFSYDTQYPLGVYDGENDRVYYTKRVDGCDQIFMTDLNANQETQLTDFLFAVNIIVPYENKIYFVGPKKDSRIIALGCYDLDTGKTSFWNDDGDTAIAYLVLDRQKKKLYVSAFSYKEESNNMEHQHETEGFVYPDYTLYATELDFSATKKIYATKEEGMIRILNDYDKVLLEIRPRVQETETNYLLIDTENGQVSDYSLPDGLINGMSFFAGTGQGIYTIRGTEADERGIFYYDVKEKTYQTIFLPGVDYGFVNNMTYVCY